MVSAIDSNALHAAERELEYWNRGRYSFVPARHRAHRLRKVLVANRGEIAKRFFFALREEGIASVAVAVEGDRAQSWLAYADEVISLGEDPGGYTNIPLILAAMLKSNANALYPGYGFLSENPDFVDALERTARTSNRELYFMGPAAEIMRRVGNKLDARELARSESLPLFEGSAAFAFPNSMDSNASDAEHIAAVCQAAREIGYPVILKLNAGGGGKGMVVAEDEAGLVASIPGVRRIGQSMYGDDTFYLERYITQPVHIEVQVFNGRAIGLRKCAVQRRKQKIIEENGDVFLDSEQTGLLFTAAENFARASGYADGAGAGTVEFLYDGERGEFGFLEMNTRLQVEYTVTDASLGIDLARWQIMNFDGRADEIPFHQIVQPREERPHALQCRIYAEDASANYAPSPGRIRHIELPTFNGVRCDFGFKSGDIVLKDYDPMIGKLIAWGADREQALLRMERALGELSIHGITSNVDQLLAIVRSHAFRRGDYNNNLLENEAALTAEPGSRDLAQEAALLATAIFREQLFAQAVVSTLPDFPSAAADFDRARRTRLPAVFAVQVLGETLRVELLPIALDQFLGVVDGRYIGRLQILQQPVHSGGRYELRLNSRRYIAEADLRKDLAILKLAGGPGGGVEYYRLQLRPVTEDEDQSSAEIVRAPFQASFVRFEGDQIRVGHRVKAGDPVLMVSAMKMETLIASPVDGEIIELIQDGDPERLILGVTPAGLVRGKSINEGELLFKIQKDGMSANGVADQAVTAKAARDVLSNLRAKTLREALERKPEIALREALLAVRACLLGFVEDDEIIENLGQALAELPEQSFGGSSGVELARELLSVLELFQLLRLASAPARLAQTREWLTGALRSDGTDLSEASRAHYCEQLVRIYSSRSDNLPAAVFGILHGFRAAPRCAPIVRALLNLVAGVPQLPRLRSVLLRLLEAAELHEDLELESSTRACLARAYPGLAANVSDIFRHADRSFFSAYRRFSRDPLSLLPGIRESRAEFTERCRASLSQSAAHDADELVPDSLPEWARLAVSEKIARLKTEHPIRRLHSGTAEVLLYLLDEASNPEFVCLALGHEGSITVDRGADGRIIGAPGLENAVARSTALLTIYHQLAPEISLRVEVLACGQPTAIDLGSRDPRLITPDTFLRSARAILPFLAHLKYRLFSIDVLASLPGGQSERLQLHWYERGGTLRVGLLLPEDPRHPYCTPAPERDLRLLAREKWTAEQWARLAFDGGEFAELWIPSVDDDPDAQGKAVGARIFQGSLGGRPAVFFCKDSRVSGGATGDREGRKYVAAAYLAYRTNVPLYVWNDGAGANIRQGMVSLNRAAQGFMMNALLCPPVSQARFAQTIREQADPVLGALFVEMDAIIAGLDASVVERNASGGPRKNLLPDSTPDNVFVVAIGVGSSTGLDVYGSSQAAVQLLLDSENSYRVLTGSAVIKAVTGEEHTNYAIGGAPMMGRLTGTVDWIVPDRLQMLAAVRCVQQTFARPKRSATSGEIAAPELITPVVDPAEAFARDYVALKEDFAAAATLSGGAIQIAGSPLVILEPRTGAGIRGQAAWRKAAELCRLADKTGAHLAIICDQGWRAGPPVSAGEMQARRDFLQTLSALKGLRFLIGANPAVFADEGLAAAVDFQLPIVSDLAAGTPDAEAVQRIATVPLSSRAEGLRLIQRILELQRGAAGAEVPALLPEIPENANSPFDMESCVIERVFDTDSWLQVYPDRSSSLLTGFARLAGRPVSVIADQPTGGQAPDAPGTEKFRIFMELAERMQLPLLMLSNAPGFVPGVKQERLRIQQVGGVSLDVNVRSTMPVLSVVLNHNYGGRQIQAFSKYLRPGITGLALRSATMAVMGPGAAFDLFHGKEYERLVAADENVAAQQLRDDYMSSFRAKSRADADASATGLIDGLIEAPADLREELIAALEFPES